MDLSYTFCHKGKKMDKGFEKISQMGISETSGIVGF